MSRRGVDRRRFLGGLLGTLTAAASCGRRGARRGPPNVVLVVADDLGIDALEPYGGRGFHMPALKRLCEEGTRFDVVWATPLCTPSRVEFLTGLYPCHTGWTRNIEDRMEDPGDGTRAVDPALPSFARLLREAGYDTFLCGKWQLALFHEQPDHPRLMGFDDWCCWSWLVPDGNGGLARTSRYHDPSVVTPGREPRVLEGRYGPDVFFDSLVDFMRRRRVEPFLALWNMVLPHPPFQPTPDQGGSAKNRTSDPLFFRPMLSYLDRLLGRLVDALDEEGLSERTLLLFTSDNGTPPDVTVRFRGRGTQGSKGRLTELGVRVPLVARWPGRVPAGRVTSALVDFADFVPTLAEVAGLSAPGGDGASFVRALFGGEEGRATIYSQLGSHRCLRGRRLKVYEDGRLYEPDTDPFEERDLSDRRDLEGVRGSLLERLRSICS